MNIKTTLYVNAEFVNMIEKVAEVTGKTRSELIVLINEEDDERPRQTCLCPSVRTLSERIAHHMLAAIACDGMFT